MITYKHTPDGRCIGVDIIAVNGFPHVSAAVSSEQRLLQDNMIQFQSLVKEFHGWIADGRVVMEILWMTEAVTGQAYKSNIRIFLILRGYW